MENVPKRVVITGVGAITPVGLNAKDTWANLLVGKSGAGPITRFDAEKFKTRFACEVKGFDPKDFLDRKEIKRADRFGHFSLAIAAEALGDSGLLADGLSIDSARAGVIWASSLGGFETIEQAVSEYATGDGTPKFGPFYITNLLANMGAGVISIKYGFRGVNYSPVSACASATHALIEAFNYVRNGKADFVVAGGADAGITPSIVGGFNAIKALSTRNDAPEKASRPFDADRDGFVIAEGGGGMIFEELEHAKRRGATIYAEVGGMGAAADAYHLTATHPEGLGAISAMSSAIEEAGLTPADVDYVNAHATSTPVGDVGEMSAIAKLFEGNLDKLSVSSSKSMTGHLLGAAGGVEALVCVMAIKEGKIPPTINLANVDPELPQGVDLTANALREREVKVAMSNNFGFGGHNGVALFKKYEE